MLGNKEADSTLAQPNIVESEYKECFYVYLYFFLNLTNKYMKVTIVNINAQYCVFFCTNIIQLDCENQFCLSKSRFKSFFLKTTSTEK